MSSPDIRRLEQVRSEWLAITRDPVPDDQRFSETKRQAEELIDTGRWSSGPADMLSVLGRQRDELTHSRLIGWLLIPTGRHGLGRAFLRAFLDAVWPGEAFMASGPVTVEIETTASALDEDGQFRGARADIVVRGNDVTVVIENKLDAGEQPDQCERLYWSWAADPGDTRWLFLTPTGRPPVTATSTAARAAWRTMSYAQLHTALNVALDQSQPTAAAGRPAVLQYLATLSGAIAR